MISNSEDICTYFQILSSILKKKASRISLEN